MKKKKFGMFGFSLMELVVSFIVVAVIAGTATPILFKKSSKMKLKGLKSISMSCDAANPTCSQYGGRCQVFQKSVQNGQTVYVCALCTRDAINGCKEQGKYFDSDTCECKNCATAYGSNCTRCNKDFCTGCTKGYGFAKGNASNQCNKCPKGTYSDNANGVTEACKPCPAGYYCKDEGMTDGKKYPCQKGNYCPPGSVDQIPCPAGCACPSAKMTSLKSDTRGVSCPTDDKGQIYPCQKGYYCPAGSEIDTKVACPQHTFRSSWGGKSVDDCTKCSSFRAHTVAYSIANTSSTVCVCDKGLYLNNSMCTNCPVGTYKLTIGNELILCLECPSGAICPRADIDPTYCNCGQVPNADKTVCTNCTSPNLVSPQKSSICSGCTGNQAPASDKCSCVDCPYLMVANSNNTACVCKCGYKLINGACSLCSGAAEYSGVGAAVCSACPSGTIARPSHCGCCPSNATSCDDNGCATACKSGYYKSGCGCVKCSDTWANCTKCEPTKCTECKNGYSLSNGACKDATCEGNNGIKIKIGSDNYCVTAANAGDSKGAALPGSVSSVAVGRNCSASSKKCCWTGKTAGSGCTSASGLSSVSHSGHPAFNYAACQRTVCEYDAAVAICSNYSTGALSSWRLPTLAEMRVLGTKSSYLGSDGLQFCDLGTSGSGAPKCTENYNCPGANLGLCHPHRVWAQGQNFVDLYAGSYTYTYQPAGTSAFSVRCIHKM